MRRFWIRFQARRGSKASPLASHGGVTPSPSAGGWCTGGVTAPPPAAADGSEPAGAAGPAGVAVAAASAGGVSLGCAPGIEFGVGEMNTGFGLLGIQENRPTWDGLK